MLQLSTSATSAFIRRGITAVASTTALGTLAPITPAAVRGFATSHNSSGQLLLSLQRRSLATATACSTCGSSDRSTCPSRSHPLPPSPISGASTSSFLTSPTAPLPHPPLPVPPPPPHHHAPPIAPVPSTAPVDPVASHIQAAVARSANEQTQLLSSTFYRRPLPSHLMAFTSKEGKRLFKEALAAGYAENYFSLAGTFTTQSEPAYCGLGSLAMVLNALEVDPKKRWKGSWRWYSEEMLECCAPLDVVKSKGITFKEFSCMAKCNGLTVIAKRGDEVTLDEFIADLKASTSNAFPTETHMVVSFSRKALGQTGDGHFSPVTVFHPQSNKLLVLDVAMFKYPSYFVDVELLYQSMQMVDKETGLPRGYFLLQKRQEELDPLSTPASIDQSSTAATSPLLLSAPPTVPDSRLDLAPAVPLCKVRNADLRDPSWVRIARVFCSHIPRAVKAHTGLQQPAASPDTIVSTLVERILGAIPPSFEISFTEPGIDRTLPLADNEAIRRAHAARFHVLVQGVIQHPLYHVVRQALSRASLPIPSPASTSTSAAAAAGATTSPSLARSSPLLGSAGPARLRKWTQPLPSFLVGSDMHPADLGAIAATVLLLSVPREAYVRAVHQDVITAFERVRARGALQGPLKFEIERIHDQLQSLTHEYCECQNRAKESGSKAEGRWGRGECRLP
ncbi:Phytochelatin synthase-domain-containing protein [Catenaria anguillulae PL171]|uniref:glutathione gamma-glutamylcysteinyltransferase n=1 Tax=Catenaria anguillulae PL171 TaxID=765915 RepID=A0A1Y2HLZ6_9FUNG|nr:Phytochelatin synthase-domain-containing protein [Catenaria anguillulae PL171]